MTTSITCPHCRQTAEVDETQAGLTHRCSMCGESVTMPGVQNRFPGSQASDRFQFSLRKMLGFVTLACVLLGVFVGLLLPAQRNSREAARRNQCINNLKNLGLSFHLHHDIHNSLPLASSEPRTGRPGIGTGPNPAGFSWIAGLLPFMEEERLWDEIAKSTNNFQIPPFDPAAGQPELNCRNMNILRCPSYGGPERVDIANSEYQEYGPPNGKVAPALSTYVALVASHFTNSAGLGLLYELDPQHAFDGNGLLPFPTATGSSINKGLSLKAATDGTSKTVVVAETKEQAYNAWIDGQATWVIGAWQGDSIVPSPTGGMDGFLGWPDSDTTSQLSLGIGSRVPGGKVYLTAARYGAGHDRVWGPSSEHTGGAVNHVFADGHVSSIVTSAVDRNTYLRIIGRGGGEPVMLD